jgi:hypothetical protein
MTETRQPVPLPKNTQQVLQIILAAGNASYTDDEGRQVAGTPAKPGAVLPGNPLGLLNMAANGLLGGERLMMMTTRAGRHFARQGHLAAFDDSVTDVDLARWGRGEIEYVEHELLEAVDTFLHQVACTRGEALVLLLKAGVVTVAEVRTDV